MIEPLAFLVTLQALKPLFPPEPLDLLVIDLPDFQVKQLRDLAVAISAVLFRQPDQSKPKCIFISQDKLRLQGAPRHSHGPARLNRAGFAGG